ncbi:MAG TPA: Ig-like domain-containing protein, partial [Planctomycetaceae bacterium]|nr:Ig-like domain-containing protein [Planctomycetaceae bacterium]
GAITVPVSTTISAVFSEEIRASSVGPATFTLSPAESGTLSTSGNTVTFTPTAALAFATRYTVSVGTGTRDAAGNPLATSFSWSFTTRGSTIPSANAGRDVDANRGERVTLNGGLSRDPENDPLIYEWHQTDGPDVTGGSGILSGVAPAFDVPGSVSTVSFELRVADATDISLPDTIQVNVMESKERALFVRPDGSDDAVGTREQPMRTVSAAITRARTRGDGTDVYVSAGRFGGTLALATGVSLYGGFDPATWVRSRGLETRIDGGSTALTGTDVTGITVDGLTIAGSNASGIGTSAYGVLFARSSAITVSNSTILVGNGAAGTAGAGGIAGASGGSGSAGRPGVENGGFLCGSGPQPLGASGGTSLFAAGGRGGDAGRSADVGARGSAGGSNSTGVAGGVGGAGAPAGRGNWSTPATYWGADGAEGAPGQHGIGGLAFGGMTATGYTPSTGGNGSGGSAGSGGGGGGGGGGGTNNCDSWGGSGGGGGGAGGPGTPGAGGSGGGGSFGIYLFASTDIVLSNLRITTGMGGAAGDGGAGGIGGSGGEGGAYTYGGAAEQDDGSNGGRGGLGGAGGSGGAGGGGGGGPSIAVLQDAATTLTMTAIESTLFAAGQGGDSGGNPGANGEQTEFKKL